MITNFWLLFLAIAKAGLMTGVVPGLAIAVFLERSGIRIVAIGIEKVSAPAVSRHTSVALSNGNKPAREVLEAA